MGLTVFVGMLADLVAHGEDEAADQLRADLALVNSLLEQAGEPTHDEPEAIDDAGPRDWELYGYSGLHYLRRVAAHLDLRGTLPPPGDESASADPVLDAYFAATVGAEPSSPEAARVMDETADAPQTFDHLIVHSDAEGYYLPIPLEHPLVIDTDDEGEEDDADGSEDDEDEPEDLIAGGNMIGSSVALRAELVRLRDALGIPADLAADDPRLDAAADAQGSGRGWARYGVEALTCVRLLAACDASLALRSAIVFA